MMGLCYFTCKCGKAQGQIREGEETTPCPRCGRIYKGIYNEKKSTVEAKEIQNQQEY
jgi:uncharacterized C2H2 Zn-finger protein